MTTNISSLYGSTQSPGVYSADYSAASPSSTAVVTSTNSSSLFNQPVTTLPYPDLTKPDITNILLGFVQQLLSLVFEFMGQLLPAFRALAQSEAQTPSAALPETTSEATSIESEISSPSALASSSAKSEQNTGDTAATSSGTAAAAANSNDSTILQAVTDDLGRPVVLTGDGYKIACQGKDQAWTITSPDGRSTRIWGDPHVVESDGDKWDFDGRASFSFGRNKVTVETVPHANGKTITGKITIYSGNERVTIADIDQDKPRLIAAASDGRVHDAELDDGVIYKMTYEPKS
ncbi:MAG TPA: DUF1521 domain-containing protein, partial [Oligoflexia bacterium]|nr:DUF1521 domain-containing protein [Oligoflexia bacterium]